jgi:ABC-type branched-subunit amino acid transport system ATPase component
MNLAKRTDTEGPPGDKIWEKRGDALPMVDRACVLPTGAIALERRENLLESDMTRKIYLGM